MTSRVLFSAVLVSLLLAVSSADADEAQAKAVPPEEPTKPPRFDAPDTPYRYQQPYLFITPGWLITQLIPSPELAIGDDATTRETKTAFGLRWQLTPVLWSWGVHRRLSGWRFFVVDPLARMSGSLALESTFEYIGGHVDRALARPGVKATFPLAHRGEYLAFSIGTSVYTYDSNQFVAHDVGLYTLWGTLGLQGTYAPEHKIMSTLLTLRIRYF
jgi:hypothetical protein